VVKVKVANMIAEPKPTEQEAVLGGQFSARVPKPERICSSESQKRSNSMSQDMNPEVKPSEQQQTLGGKDSACVSKSKRISSSEHQEQSKKKAKLFGYVNSPLSLTKSFVQAS
jgi:hypothetical protein